MTDLRQSPQYAQHMIALGWEAKKINGVYCYVKKFPLLGSFIKVQRPNKISSTLINQIKKKYKPFQIIVEPIHAFKLPGFKQSSPYLPSKTLHLNLTPSKTKLYENCQKDCRYALRKSSSLKITKNPDLKLFRRSWKSSVPLKRYVPSLSNLQSLQKSFQTNSLFLLTKDNSAGAIFLRASTTAYYWQAFTSSTGRQALSQYQLLWQGILWAKRSGCKTFDFEGIYDSRFPNLSWQGFTHFKKSFNAQEVVYPGAFSKLYWKNFFRFSNQKKD